MRLLPVTGYAIHIHHLGCPFLSLRGYHATPAPLNVLLSVPDNWPQALPFHPLPNDPN